MPELDSMEPGHGIVQTIERTIAAVNKEIAAAADQRSLESCKAALLQARLEARRHAGLRTEV